MDSMGLTQLKGMIESSYGVEVEDEMLYDEETTIRVVEQGVLHAPPALPNAGAGADAAAGAGVVQSAAPVDAGGDDPTSRRDSAGAGASAPGQTKNGPKPCCIIS